MPRLRPILGTDALVSVFQWLNHSYGFSPDKVKPYTFNSAPFVANKTWIQQGYATSEPFAIEQEAGFKPNVFLAADYGYQSYSTTIETRREVIAKNKDLVQRFVNASIIGWYHYLYGDNSAANALIKKDNPDMTDAQLAFSVAALKIARHCQFGRCRKAWHRRDDGSAHESVLRPDGRRGPVQIEPRLSFVLYDEICRSRRRARSETQEMSAGADEAMMDEALIALEYVGKRFRNGVEALADLEPHRSRRRFPDAARPLWLRQIHGLAPDGRNRKADNGENHQPSAAQGRRNRLRVSGADADALGAGCRQCAAAAALAAFFRARSRDALRGRAEAGGIGKIRRNAYPRELSGGMRMRVSIARALVLRPQLLLMDEPFAALDEITRFRLNDDLLRLKTELGTTIVFVTHSVYESVYLSTRIAVMAGRPGRVSDEIAVDLARAADLRVSAGYLSLCQHVSEALAKAAEMSGESAEASP